MPKKFLNKIIKKKKKKKIVTNKPKNKSPTSTLNKPTPTRFLNQNTLLTKYPTGPTQTYSKKKKQNPTFFFIFLVTDPFFLSRFQIHLLLLVGLGPFFFSSSLFYFFFWWVSVLLPVSLSLFICVLYK